MTRVLVVAAAVFVPMLAETFLSHANERRLRARGAIEPDADVYRWMQLAYPGCFVAMLAEGAIRGSQEGWWLVGGAIVFVAAKALKSWAIATLGPRWSFRVLVTPGVPLVATGPYRWLRHPNYAGVLGEIAGVALMAPAPVAGVASLLGFGALLQRRIRVEERALDLSAH